MAVHQESKDLATNMEPRNKNRVDLEMAANWSFSVTVYVVPLWTASPTKDCALRTGEFKKSNPLFCISRFVHSPFAEMYVVWIDPSKGLPFSSRG